VDFLIIIRIASVDVFYRFWAGKARRVGAPMPAGVSKTDTIPEYSEVNGTEGPCD